MLYFATLTDVILIGEIRDQETASKIAIQAALTGHLVYSTLHTERFCIGLSAFDGYGDGVYLISSCIIGVMAQRLVRKLCAKCREAYVPEAEFRKTTGLKEGEPYTGPKAVMNVIIRVFKGRKCIAEFCMLTMLFGGLS